MTQTPSEKSLVVQTGNPVLRGKAQKVSLENFGSKQLKVIIGRMNTALDAEADGVAIAAPQIGVPLRIFIISRIAFTVDDQKKIKHGDKTNKAEHVDIPAQNMVFINPEIIKLSKKKVRVPEGCLSVRWFFGDTIRHEKALVRAFDENGKVFTYGGSGLIAQIFQHEIDHLDGILFTDHATNVQELTLEEIAEIQSRGKKHE